MSNYDSNLNRKKWSKNYIAPCMLFVSHSVNKIAKSTRKSQGKKFITNSWVENSCKRN